jgi:hypothetical protein
MVGLIGKTPLSLVENHVGGGIARLQASICEALFSYLSFLLDDHGIMFEWLVLLLLEMISLKENLCT